MQQCCVWHFCYIIIGPGEISLPDTYFDVHGCVMCMKSACRNDGFPTFWWNISVATLKVNEAGSQHSVGLCWYLRLFSHPPPHTHPYPHPTQCQIYIRTPKYIPSEDGNFNVGHGKDCDKHLCRTVQLTGRVAGNDNITVQLIEGILGGETIQTAPEGGESVSHRGKMPAW